MGARSAGRSVACNDFIPIACMHNMKTWGGPGTLIWMWAERGSQGLRGEDLGGVWQRTEHDLHARKAKPFTFYSSSPGPSTCTWRKLKKSGCKMQPKVNGGLITGVCLVPRQFTRIVDLLHCTLDPSLGPAWDWKGRTYMKAQHRATNGWPKVNGGHATGACWAPRAAH